MTNYTKTTDFAAKDSLPSGDSGKIIRGSEFETEFDNIATAVNSKADSANPTFTGTVTIDGLTVNGNTILGNAATDTVTVTADIASNLIPSADDTYNLGASGAEWNDLHVDGVAYIDTIDGAATSGDFTFTGASYNAVWDTSDNALEFADSAKATFGATGDLQIYHSGTHSFITDVGTGNLYLRGTNLLLTSAAGETYADFTADGAARLYHDGSAKLATTSTGIDVTGNVTFDDNGKAIFGAGSDLQIYHDGTDTQIREVGTGNLKLITDGAAIQLQSTTENMVVASPNAGVQLFYDNSEKLVTTSTGIDVTGTVVADGLSVNSGATNQGAYFVSTDSGQTIALSDSASSNLLITDSNGLNILTNGDANSAGTNATRAARFKPNKDVEFYEDTGTTAKFFWDASAEALGIGTTSPSSILTVDGGTSAFGSSGITLKRTGTVTGSSDFILAGTSGSEALSVRVNASEKMRIDSSGNVFIGKTGIDLTTAGIELRNNGLIAGTVDGSYVARFNRNTSDGEIVQFRKADSLVGSITTASGSLGITSSGSNISLTATGVGLYADSGVFRGYLSDDATLDLGASNARWKDLYLSGGLRGDTLTFSSNAGTEALRINSSGSLLVGKTSANVGNDGAQFLTTGYSGVSATSTTSFFANRNTTDGDIIEVGKNGVKVGSIGTVFGNLTIGTADTGVRFTNGDSTIRPWNLSTNAVRDNAINLGAPAGGFKDLYLSGGAYLGGTSAANKLDDYEEGTWTPAASNAQGFTLGTPTGASGQYTKVGQLVTVECGFTSLDSTETVVAGDRFEITGLPFAPSGNYTNATASVGSCVIYASYGSGVLATGTVTHSGSTLVVIVDNAFSSVTFSTDVNIAISYITTS